MNKKILVIGTLALDSIQTPLINSDLILGGAATYISFAISKFQTILELFQSLETTSP